MSVFRQERRILKQSSEVRISIVIGLCLLLVGQAAFGDAGLGQKKTLMLFPFAVTTPEGSPQSEAAAQFARDLFSLVAEGIAANRAYSVIEFEPRIACVQRAVKEQKFQEKEVLSPIDTDLAGVARAEKLAKLTGTQLAILGSIDKYVYKAGKSDPGQPAAPGQVEMAATLLLIDANSGKELYRFVATGEAAMEDPNELTIGTAATYDLAEKLLSDINKQTIELTTAASQEDAPAPVVVSAPRKHDWGLLPAMVGAALLGFLVGGK